MSASNEWTEWHLTPRGWERGTEKEDFRRVDRDPPPDRVLTVTNQEYMGSTFSAMQKSSSITWESKDKGAIAKLKMQFGEPPTSL